MNIKNKVRSAKCGVLGALVAVGLSAFAADPSVTVGEVTAGEPWSTITVNYTLGGVDAATDYKVAFDITAGGQTASVTNDATKLTDGAATKEINTVEIFGKEVVDTKAKVKVSLIAVKPKGPPAGALKGEFSVSADKKVLFSQGNLVATIDATGTPIAWKFAANQYDYIGNATANTSIGKIAGYIDLFGWSTASTTYGISTSTNNDDYSGDFYDWGKAVGDGNTWRTLTTAEWQYLFNCGDYTSDVRNGKYKWATVNGVNGYVIAPDVFSGELADTYADDAALAANNLVFLPAAGTRNGSSVSNVGTYGFYWSSTASSEYGAFRVFFGSSGAPYNNNASRFYGYSVRLVTEVK